MWKYFKKLSKHDIYVDERFIKKMAAEQTKKQNSASALMTKALYTLFSPISPFIVTFVSFTLSLLVTDASAQSNWFLKLAAENKNILFVITIVWVILTLFVTVSKSKVEALNIMNFSLENENTQLKDQLKNANKLTEDKVGLLLKNGEKVLLSKLSKDMVKINHFVDSIQVYTYTAYISNDEIEIKCNFVTGYVREQFEINSILQIYYKLDRSIYVEFKQIIKNYIALNDVTDKQKYKNKLLELINSINILIKKIMQKINTNTKNISEYHELYTNLTLLVVELFEKLEDAYSTTNEFLNKKRHEKTATAELGGEKTNQFSGDLNSANRRTGLLGSILLEDVYLFRNRKSSNKEKVGRPYGCFPFLFRNKQYITLFSINKEYFMNTTNPQYELKRLEEDFTNEIIKFL